MKRRDTVYESVCVLVEHYEVSSSAAINYNVYAPESAFDLEVDDPLYDFETRLLISGTGIDPKDKVGHQFEISIYGTNLRARRLAATLDDVQERDSYGVPKYRTYRKQQIPVFKPVKGLALLNKTRGEQRWTAWISVAPQIVSDMLLILKEERTKYLALDVVSESRYRWIRSVHVQTADPREE